MTVISGWVKRCAGGLTFGYEEKVLREYIEKFNRDGYVKVPLNSIIDYDFKLLLNRVETLEASGIIDVKLKDLQNLNDVIFVDEEFEKFARNPDVIKMVEAVLNSKVEVQHSKMINKYPSQAERSQVYWHQDYPFFPHSNEDLVAVAIHFDDESDDSGSIMFVPGSHKGGVLTHSDPQTGEFLYRLSNQADIPDIESAETVVCRAGEITLHHGNTLHASLPSKGSARRVLYIQYRAVDAVQLAGVVWKCTGMNVYDKPLTHKTARFTSGGVVELRSGGDLFDISGKFSPDGRTRKSINGG